jgi:hypothetical protein
MQERALKKIKTASGVEVEMIEYVTGGEGRTLGLMAGEVTPEAQELLQDKMIELCVKSVAGSKENILENVKNLRLPEYLAIIQECTSLFGGLDDQKKTK